MRNGRHYNILAVHPLWDKAQRDTFMGILEALSGYVEWHLTAIRPGRFFTPKELVNEYGEPYDGFIIPLTGSQEVKQRLIEMQRPMVLLNITDPEFCRNCRGNISTIWTDNEDIGRRAADFLLDRGNYAAAGYVHELTDEFYSEERYMAFRKRMAQEGITAYGFWPHEHGEGYLDPLRQWLRKLPKPAAIMTVSDMRAVDVIRCCKDTGICVPHEIAVIGVDNDFSQHKKCGMSISSVQPNFRGMGFRAVEELEFLLKHPNPRRRLREFLIPVYDIYAGQSTGVTARSSALVSKILDYIRQYHERALKPDQVAERFGYSRKLLELRMRENGRATLRVEIENVRLEAAQGLLDKGQSVASVVKRLNFTSANQFYRIYRRHFGHTLRRRNE